MEIKFKVNLKIYIDVIADIYLVQNWQKTRME